MDDMTAVRHASEMLISVVVPVLDEAATVESLLDHLGGLDGRLEVILADGGSTGQFPSPAAGADRQYHGAADCDRWHARGRG